MKTALWVFRIVVRVNADLLLKSAARRARIRLETSAGAVRSRLFAAKVVRGETVLDDGSIELSVELPDVELLALARTAGVQIVEAPADNMPCAPDSAYLQSTPVSNGSGGAKHA